MYVHKLTNNTNVHFFPFLLPCYLRLVGGEKLLRQPPAPFFILSYTIQIYMHNDSEQCSFLKPITLEDCDWPIKMQRCQYPSKILVESQEKQKVSQAKQEQSENRPHRTPKSGKPQYEYKMRKYSHEGIEMQMHHIADRKRTFLTKRIQSFSKKQCKFALKGAWSFLFYFFQSYCDFGTIRIVIFFWSSFWNFMP